MKPLALPRFAFSLAVFSSFTSSCPVSAVRLNPDGLGQGLIYPYYTTRSTPTGNAFVTLFTVTNVSARPKALRVRFLEGKAGAEVLNFNLFLSAYDVWAAGLVPSATGAGIFTKDYSCSSPVIERNGAAPTSFRNQAYIGDFLDDDLDRTQEGYFEILEMGTIDPMSQLGASVIQSPDFSLPNNSKPSCQNLPATDAIPSGLSAPTGGLIGNVSYINVNEGTDYTADAVALSQWSDKVQWSAAGGAHPTLADASPAVSYVVDTVEMSDKAYLTQWARGQDAVSAVFMVDQVFNDYTVEPNIKAATDWILTMPTKRYYTTPTTSEAPFAGDNGLRGANTSWCEVRRLGCLTQYDEGAFDREGQSTGEPIFCFGGNTDFCGAVANLTFSANGGIATTSHVFESRNPNNIALNAGWINGFLPYQLKSIGRNKEFESTWTRGLAAPIGATTISDLRTGTVQTGATVTYYGLPVVGFAAQSYTNGLLPGAGENVLSNYGGTFAHKYRRRIVVSE